MIFLHKLAALAMLVVSINVASATTSFYADELFSELKTQALSLIGLNYKYGGIEPSTGFDCSGFVKYIFSSVGIDLPRTTRDQVKVGELVSLEDLQPGDLVFFNTKAKFSHVGMYIGDNQFVHSPRQGQKIEVAFLEGYWMKTFGTARRVI